MIPAVCVAGWSNAGKTTLVEGLLPVLARRGVRAAVIKHSHHQLQMDKPGADTQRYRGAGAQTVMLAAADATAVILSAPCTLRQLLAMVRDVELVLVEGFDQEAEMPTIEVRRDGSQPMRSQATWRRAVVGVGEDGLPCFAPEDVEGIAAFILSVAQIDASAE